MRGEDDLEARALGFARRAHEAVGQRRKQTGEPYIVHPMAVAELVRTVPHRPEMMEDRMRAEDLAQAVDGVAEVRNHLVLQSDRLGPLPRPPL